VLAKLLSGLILLLLAVWPLAASEYHAVVTFGGLSVPGAIITAAQGGQKLAAITDQQGTGQL
jgi:hypothetical protein